jgi:small conductance mechanosensitive channel
MILKLDQKSRFIERIFASYASDSKRQVVKQRVKTFRGLLTQAVRILSAIFFLFIVLDSIRIDLKPLLAGIGVVGIGLSLAAQNILRDFLNGLFIIIEDQFNVGDWVTIGSYSGTVEVFTMRATRLRATDGRLIIIPNGTIQQVVNSTKDFGVCYVEVGVSYDSDISRVIRVLESCGEELTGMYTNIIIEQPRAQGILDFRENDILLRVLVKTIPGEQWGVERALRMIIKDRFDKEGITIPFPQIVTHLPPREESSQNGARLDSQDGPDPLF